MWDARQIVDDHRCAEPNKMHPNKVKLAAKPSDDICHTIGEISVSLGSIFQMHDSLNVLIGYIFNGVRLVIIGRVQVEAVRAINSRHRIRLE